MNKCISIPFYIHVENISFFSVQTMVLDPGGTLRISGVHIRPTNYDLVWVISLPREILWVLIRFTKYQMMRGELDFSF